MKVSAYLEHNNKSHRDEPKVEMITETGTNQPNFGITL